jgi:transcriptional regulator with XRE-family HTH domain
MTPHYLVIRSLQGGDSGLGLEGLARTKGSGVKPPAGVQPSTELIMANQRTARAAVGREIRNAREDKRLSRAAVAKSLHVSDSLVAAWESGRITPRPEYIHQLIDVLAFGSDAVARLMGELVSGEALPEWEGKWLRLEEQATSLLSYETIVIPGLLQTAEYARAVLQLNQYAPHDIEEQVQARLERQRVLSKDDRPLFFAVLDEAVLRRPVGGARCMYEQLMHVVELAEQPEPIVQVIPTSVGEHAGFAGPLMIASSANGQDVAFVDSALGGNVAEQIDDVAVIKRLWYKLLSTALPEKASVEFIEKAAQEWSVL